MVSFDWAIKRLLRDKAGYEVLEGFLSELLRDDIRILEVLESEGNQEEAKDKYNRKVQQFDDIVRDALDILKLSSQERAAYERHCEDLHYQASMVESSYGLGKLEGIKKGEEISRLTGLTAEDIERIE